MVDDRSATLFDEDGGPTPPLQANVGGRRLLGRLAVVTAVLPWVVAVGRALTGGWTASADNALLAIRGLDVLSVSHHPLLGAVSTVSSSTGIIVHHPGPLLFGIIAVPSWLLGTAAGIPLAIGTVNALCAGWIVLVAGRVGGLSARLVSAMAVALLGWTMTWPRMVEPWNPHSAMVPALLFFVACGALTLGEPRVALPAVVGGSLCLQAHIGYVYIVALVAMVTLGLRWLDRRMDPGAAPRWTVRNRVTPLVVLVLLWMQPILDLVVNGRASNVASMLRVAGSPPPTLPRGDAIRLVAAVIALPPWWLPGGFNDLTVLNPPPGMAAAAPALVVVVALLALIGWRGATPARPRLRAVRRRARAGRRRRHGTRAGAPCVPFQPEPLAMAVGAWGVRGVRRWLGARQRARAPTAARRDHACRYRCARVRRRAGAQRGQPRPPRACRARSR